MTLAQRQVLQARQGLTLINFKIWSARYLSDRLPVLRAYAADGQTLYLPDAEWHEEHDEAIGLGLRLLDHSAFGQNKNSLWEKVFIFLSKLPTT